MAHHDNCDNCQEDYDFDGNRDMVVVYLRDCDCNHIEAHCPFCQSTTRIYVEPEVLISIMAQVSFKTIRMYPAAPDDIKAAHSGLVPPPTPETPADLPPIPRDWSTSLWDTLREFGGES